MEARESFFKEGNLTFDGDSIIHSYSESPEFTSLLNLVNSFNALYLLYKKEFAIIDSASTVEYRDLSKKYETLMETYSSLKNRLVFYDKIPRYTMTTKIDSGKNGELTFFTIGFGNVYGDFVSLVVRLGENFGIDYESSAYYERNKQTKLSNEEWDNILSTTCVNRKHLTRDSQN